MLRTRCTILAVGLFWLAPLSGCDEGNVRLSPAETVACARDRLKGHVGTVSRTEDAIIYSYDSANGPRQSYRDLRRKAQAREHVLRKHTLRDTRGADGGYRGDQELRGVRASAQTSEGQRIKQLWRIADAVAVV